MRHAPRWVLLPAGCAPVLLVGAWSIAQVMQTDYDPVTQTISVLAAYGAPGYWVMTGILIALGLCYVVTAGGLRAAALPGRAALAGGGLAALTLTLVPAPSRGGDFGHGTVATIGFLLLGVWPALGAVRPARAGRPVPWALRPRPALAASAGMALCALWFVCELQLARAPGIAERALTFLQALWPLLVVLTCVRRPAGAGPEGAPAGPGAVPEYDRQE